MSEPTRSTSHKVIVDWGTTSFRAFLVDESSQVIDSIENERGIQVLSAGQHEGELTTHITPWLATHGPMTILALGMITSRNGWVEVPYVSCPAGPADLAAGIIYKDLGDGSQVCFLPGINDPARAPYPDVMRGEETQIVGFGLGTGLTLVLPGTHSKWARAENGRIARFQTFVTGELYALLSQHSFIAKTATPVDEQNMQDFDLGVLAAKSDLPEAAALPTLLFSARTGMLARKLAPNQTRDYVSGLLIGHEFRCAIACGWITPGSQIGIVGNDGLNALYSRTAALFDLQVIDGGEEAGLKGALTIAACAPASHSAVA